jgi:hypothetical protein
MWHTSMENDMWDKLAMLAIPCRHEIVIREVWTLVVQLVSLGTL